MRALTPSDGLKTLVATAALALLLLLLGLPLLADRVDRQAAAHERRLAAAGYRTAIGAIRDVVESSAIWDAMYQHTAHGADTAWLDDNLTSSNPGDPLGALMAVADGADRLVFMRERAQALTVSRAATARRALVPTLARLRAMEAAARRAGDASAANRVSYAGTVVMAGEVYVAIAARIDAASNDFARVPRPQPVLLVMQRLREKVLPTLVDNLELVDPLLSLRADVPRPAAVALRDSEDRPVAYLGWRPRRPGTALLTTALLPILGVGGTLMAVAVIAYRKGRRNAAALAASEARTKHLAYHDQLTDLPNRRMLKEWIDVLARMRRPITLLMVDLDRFKEVNDTYGHQSGDELIGEVARRLTALCRSDDMCVRLGGDEFVVLMADAGREAALSLSDRIIAHLSMPVDLAKATVQVGATVGIAVRDGTAVDADELLRRADMALYRAKESARGTACVYSAEMDEALRDRRELEHDLRLALAEGAILVAYQPQYNGDVLVGVEALARWTHPARGPISPADFAPLAEECGLIEALGFAVLRRAVLDARAWPGLRVAVNLSALQVRARGFTARVRALFEELDVSPTRFDLEITESVLMTDNAQVRSTLQELRSLGFRLALDDFGTGYSSLSYLRRFPIDKIKIDRSFVTTLPEDAIAAALVAMIVHLCRSLRLSVIAEGVETETQRAALEALGCRSFQGFLTGRPMPAAAITARLAATGATLAAAD